MWSNCRSSTDFTKNMHLPFRNYSRFMQSISIFRISKVFGQVNVTIIVTVFHTWVEILCGHWLPEAPTNFECNQFHLMFFNGFFGLSAVSFVFSNLKAALLRSGDWLGLSWISHFCALRSFAEFVWCEQKI